ncbi:MAG TPA: universal stress protein [Thermoanaerobaculia bacterium]
MIHRILVPLDGSALAEQSLPQAAALAKACDAEVFLLRVLEPQVSEGGVDLLSWRLARAEAGAYVGKLAKRLGEQGVRATPLTAEGRAAEEILKTARERAVELMVVCSHGRGGKSRFHLGGTAQKVVSGAEVSLLIVRASDSPREIAAGPGRPRVMVPLDGSQRAQWALCLAASIARAWQGEILLVHVVETRPLQGQAPPSPEEQELLRKLVSRDRRIAEGYLADTESLLKSSGVAVRTLLAESPHVAQTLNQMAMDEKAAMIVVSAHGCSGAAPWRYGNVADRLIAYGDVPLLIFQDLPLHGEAEAEAPARLAALAGT